MRITDIRVFPVREEKLKAFVSIVLDECFMINDIKVIKGKEGYFISMPSRRKRTGKFKDIAHPLNNETRQAMEKEILAAYDEVVDEAAATPRELKSELAGGENAPRPEPRPAAATVAAGEDSFPAEQPADPGKSLEEVAEHHLRDSFWST